METATLPLAPAAHSPARSTAACPREMSAASRMNASAWSRGSVTRSRAPSGVKPVVSTRVPGKPPQGLLGVATGFPHILAHPGGVI